MSTLARIVDPEAVGALSGPSARLGVQVPATWGGRTIQVTAPARLVCSRCEGGGCEGCNKSGAFKVPGDEAARQFTVTLPATGLDGSTLRLLRPLGADTIETLLLEVRLGDRPSDKVTLLSSSSASPETGGAGVAPLVALLLVVALVIALVVR